MRNVLKFFVLAVLLGSMLGCESDNEHFCARYQYLYDQLLADDVSDYSEMNSQLLDNMSNPDKDREQAKFMHFVLQDWRMEIKPEHEESRKFCMRMKRWQNYQ